MKSKPTENDVVFRNTADLTLIWDLSATIPKVERVVFADPITAVYWDDGIKTVVKKMDGDTFNEEIGFMACVTKRIFGGHNQYKRLIKNAERPNRSVR